MRIVLPGVNAPHPSLTPASQARPDLDSEQLARFLTLYSGRDLAW